ncbi:ABC-2 type transport system ATP-binding protein [Anaerobacterium chartisolvens]|uniref:ABC-2 type transport system ATP-binding protein n=1 Tax=Anaerobacterium chartisolvens TaxID=1297424 RepID=A0A369AC17_9FIRM|nr:ABC transporter ATP-binding protein [Anaerobacterium chartisolvens]RCX06900.1 ABC-2 type transport system ATP-binding protein [Anaerobacterium chartisolvens]
MDYILKLDGVSKKFSESNFALNDISFALPYGSIMGYIGENGAGKTTTIGCILNTIIQDCGTITIFGKEMNDSEIMLRQDIGVVYDGDNFPTYLTAEKLANVMRGLYKNWDDSLYQKYLANFKLNPKQKVKTYSKGMSMKLAITVALAHHPQLLILDEATSGLDPVMREEILEVFLDFVQDERHSILLSSHITSDLEKVADYITFIHDGSILLSAKKDDLLYNYAIMRCKSEQFTRLDKNDILAYRKRDYQIDVLVADKSKAERKYKDIVIDTVSIDEITLLLIKGERL